MSVGFCFLRKMLESTDLSYMTDNGISPEYFVDAEKPVYEFIQNHVQAYSEFPSLGVVERELDFKFPTVPESTLNFWRDRLIRLYRARTIRNTMLVIQTELAKGRIEQAEEFMQQGALKLQETSSFKISTLQALAEQVLARHDALQQGQVLIDVPFGFPYLDTISDGLQKGDTIALAGETGVGKTYVTCAMANNAHTAGKVPLIISMEMKDFLVARRLMALRLRLSENRLKRGRLFTLSGRQAVVDDIEAMKREHPVYLMDGKFTYHVEDLILHIKTLKPDVVYIDGAYLMESRGKYNGTWEGIAGSTKQLKMLAGATDVPIVGTYQLLDGKKHIYGGRAIEHLASMVLHLKKDTDEESIRSWDGIGYRILEIKKGRYGEYGAIRLIYNMINQEISQREVISGQSSVGEEEG